MRRFFTGLFVLSLSLTLPAQEIRYELSAPNAAHHEAEIELTVSDLPAGPAFFRMSRSSPGRYATHEFGKNVYNVKATDSKGKALPLEKTEADVFRVAAHNGSVKLSYTLYANYADGTYAEIDPTHFHLNMPATFMWVKGLDKAPITLHLALPHKNWKVATQLKLGVDENTFTAPGLHYFMDSPVKAGDLHLKEWSVNNSSGKVQKVRLALHAPASDSALNAFTKHLQKLVLEAKAVFGELPSFDYSTYTFLASINPYVEGDGMEHRNSTMITLPQNFDGNADLLGVFAHEFFHAWNVERIRPKSLEPFNFEKSNVSEALWIAEGFTQYFGQLLMKRAGFTSDEDFRRQVAGLITTKENTPGAMNYTPIEASKHAVFVDAGVSVDHNNYANMFTSYYTYGGALALALDLQLRQQFGKSMDVFMQELWVQFGIPEKPYTLPQVQAALAAISSVSFASNFFQKHVYGHQPIDYAPLLKEAGWKLEKSGAGEAWIGNNRFNNENGSLVLSANTARNTPLYNAGVDVSDTILELDGKTITTKASLDAVLNAHQPGEEVTLLFSHRGENKSARLTFANNPALSIEPVEKFSAKQIAFAQNWYGSKVK